MKCNFIWQRKEVQAEYSQCYNHVSSQVCNSYGLQLLLTESSLLSSLSSAFHATFCHQHYKIQADDHVLSNAFHKFWGLMVTFLMSRPCFHASHSISYIVNVSIPKLSPTFWGTVNSRPPSGASNHSLLFKYVENFSALDTAFCPGNCSLKMTRELSQPEDVSVNFRLKDRLYVLGLSSASGTFPLTSSQ